MMREITSCEVCGNSSLIPVLNLGPQPLPDDLVAIGDTRICEKYPTEILFCDVCKTAHQRFQVDNKIVFPPEYHYRSGQTKDVLDGMQQFVASVEKHGYVHGLKVLDIGCNDGNLLTYFKERGARTFGVDPTDAAKEALAAGHLVSQNFFSYQWARDFFCEFGSPDIITFVNVFAHITNLEHIIDALNTLKHADTLIVIENHYLGSVLDRHQFDTFYHEHPRTYSYTSFVHIAHALGMHVDWVEFPVRYGGDIRVFLRPGPQGSSPQYIEREKDFLSRFQMLDVQVDRWRQAKRAKLLDVYMNDGAIAAAAFPGRAAILLGLLGLTEREVSAVYEKASSKKIGYYVPSTRIPILSDELYFGKPSHISNTVLNLAWHIPAEIEARWRAHGFEGRFIQAVSEEDFR